jgi:hypothetical protein
MGASGIGYRPLCDPIAEGFGLLRVEEVGVIRLLEHGKNRCRLVGGQRRRLTLRVRNTANRVKVVFDAVAGCRRRPAMTIDAALFEDRIHIGKNERWLLELALLGAAQEHESAEGEPR